MAKNICVLVEEAPTLLCPDEFSVHRHVPFYYRMAGTGALPVESVGDFVVEPCPECTYMRHLKARA
jgi:hypothetical protein